MTITDQSSIKIDDGVNEALAGKVHGERWARKHATPEQLDAIAVALEPVFFVDPMHEVVASSIDEENAIAHRRVHRPSRVIQESAKRRMMSAIGPETVVKVSPS